MAHAPCYSVRLVTRRSLEDLNRGAASALSAFYRPGEYALGPARHAALFCVISCSAFPPYHATVYRAVPSFFPCIFSLLSPPTFSATPVDSAYTLVVLHAMIALLAPRPLPPHVSRLPVDLVAASLHQPQPPTHLHLAFSKSSLNRACVRARRPVVRTDGSRSRRRRGSSLCTCLPLLSHPPQCIYCARRIPTNPSTVGVYFRITLCCVLRLVEAGRLGSCRSGCIWRASGWIWVVYDELQYALVV
ncbi:hypothetical protein C8Q70DRAFT_664306 [Cubamyces menziesii]|nr:hypothetical protein C8Q70DRAFT_664306 [Cubamyces menziesii]